ncbi:hypothetical protein [Klebsiella phage 05F01]|nr:hypothetical protein [Klebsiella phage 05F01]
MLPKKTERGNMRYLASKHEITNFNEHKNFSDGMSGDVNCAINTLFNKQLSRFLHEGDVIEYVDENLDFYTADIVLPYNDKLITEVLSWEDGTFFEEGILTYFSDMFLKKVLVKVSKERPHNVLIKFGLSDLISFPSACWPIYVHTVDVKQERSVYVQNEMSFEVHKL